MESDRTRVCEKDVVTRPYTSTCPSNKIELPLSYQRQRADDCVARMQNGLFLYVGFWFLLMLADDYMWNHPVWVGVYEGGLVLLAALRLWSHQKIKSVSNIDFPRAQQLFRYAAWAFQGYWGLGCAWVVMAPDAPVLRWMMLMVTVGFVTAGSAIMAIDTLLARSIPLLLLGPTTLLLLWAGGGANGAIFLIFIAFFIYTIKLSQLIGGDYTEKQYVQFTLEQRAHELELAHEQMRKLASHDALTGLVNRRQMLMTLSEYVELSRRELTGFSVVIIDLDFFKRVNDTYGHGVGDEVLRGFAQCAQQVLRETDIVGRWGGEEFLVLMPDRPDHTPAMGIVRLQKQLEGERISTTVPDLRLQFSAGITAYRNEEAIEATIERADKALYAAKTGGRNRLVQA